MEVEIPDTIQELAREYLDFLDDEDDNGVYNKRMREMVNMYSCRMLVNINDLRKKKPERARQLLRNSAQEQIALQNALKEFVMSSDALPKCYNDYYVGFEGSFGDRHVTPRTLSCRFLNNLVCLEGIVTQCSLVRPKVVRSVHYCPATQKLSDKRYTDMTSLNPLPTSSAYPTKDNDGNLLETEYGLSTYKDHQTLIIQEMPEKAPAGQLPRAVDVICDNDLADKCKPGDRVQIVGIYKCLPGKQNGFTSGVFRTVLIASNITHLSKEAKFNMTREDIANCRKIAKKRNVFDLLSRSLAPSIHGHEYVKKAILCMLLGGVEKNLPNGTRLRGDINILLIGDPSVAKSQILRYVLGTAPRAIATTGRGSSGVGLTAAVTSDPETGEKRLEAGAMVLADRGVVCIDEFDKMSDIDRTAIHEVMEQGRVTIAKAGIHARLNARCSVLAAANPVYGKYDQYKPPMENIGLQDSLLSRFDLLFVMLDTVNSEVDSKIADHVVRMHRYRNPTEQDGEVLPMGANVDLLSTQDKEKEPNEKKSVPMYEKYDPLWHGNSRKKTDRIFTVKFMRIYLHIARTLKPSLTDEASLIIAEEYSRIRSQDAVEAGVARTQPVTVRTLETMIRLASAHAKSRLSCRVEEEDALAALELIQYAYFKKVLEKERKRRREATTSDEEDEIVSPRAKKTSSKRKAPDTSIAASTQPETVPTPAIDEETLQPDMPMDITDTTPDSITDERFLKFKRKAADLFRTANIQTIPLAEFEKTINADLDISFSKGEINVALQKMTDENQIMESEGVLYLI